MPNKDYIRLEGQSEDEVPLYMTEPSEPSWFVRTAWGSLEIRVENGKPWVRESRNHQWRATNIEEPE